MQFYLKSVEETMAHVKSQASGITEAEAAARIEANGKNKLISNQTFIHQI